MTLSRELLLPCSGARNRVPCSLKDDQTQIAPSSADCLVLPFLYHVYNCLSRVYNDNESSFILLQWSDVDSGHLLPEGGDQDHVGVGGVVVPHQLGRAAHRVARRVDQTWEYIINLWFGYFDI